MAPLSCSSSCWKCCIPERSRCCCLCPLLAQGKVTFCAPQLRLFPGNVPGECSQGMFSACAQGMFSGNVSPAPLPASSERLCQPGCPSWIPRRALPAWLSQGNTKCGLCLNKPSRNPFQLRCWQSSNPNTRALNPREADAQGKGTQSLEGNLELIMEKERKKQPSVRTPKSKQKTRRALRNKPAQC